MSAYNIAPTATAPVTDDGSEERRPASARDEPPKRRFRRRPSALTVLTILLFSGVVIYRVLVPPVVGAADNGDYLRLMRWFQLAPVSTPTSPSTTHGGWITLHYRSDHQVPRDRRFLSSQVPLTAAAVGLSRVAGQKTFDLRILGLVNGVMLVAAVGIIMTGSRQLGRLRWILSVGVLLIFVDISYTSYLNSFFSETASLIAGLGLMGACVWAAVGEGPRLPRLGLVAAAGIVFAFAKPQNGLLAIPLALFVAWIGLRTGSRRYRLQVLALCGALVICGGLSFQLRPTETSQENLYNAVFFDLLKHSPTPARDASSLGLDPSLVRYAGTYAFQPGAPLADPAFQRAFYGRTSYGKLLIFFVSHPDRLKALISRSSRSAFVLRPDYLGNFTFSKNRRPYAQSHSLAWWTWLQGRIPGSVPSVGLAILLPLVIAGAAFWKGDRRLRAVAGVVVLFVGLAALEFLIVVVGEGEYELIKHLFEFHVLLDSSIALSVVLVGGLVAPLLHRSGSRKGEVRPSSAARSLIPTTSPLPET